MDYEFHRISQTLSYVLGYYDIFVIKQHLDIYSGTSNSLSSSIESRLNTVYILFERMTNEINQVLQTNNNETKLYIFNTLRDWLTDYRIEDVNKQYIHNLIDDYNVQTYNEFELKIEKEVEQFQQSDDYKNRKHLEQYQIQLAAKGSLFAGVYLHDGYTMDLTFHKFYNVTEKADLIDTKYISQYFDIVTIVLNGFRDVIDKSLKLWDEYKQLGKLSNIEAKTAPELPDIPKQERPKLKFKKSKPFVAYLFKMLYEYAVLDVESKEELYRFVEFCITTPDTDKSGKTSAGGFKNAFLFPTKEAAKYWELLFETMRKRAEQEKGKKKITLLPHCYPSATLWF